MKILIGGDYVPLKGISEMMEQGDYSYFDDIKPFCEEADYSIINLEAPIVKSESNAIEKCGPNLKTSPNVIKSLKYAGIDMVTLANNHIMDFGEIGLHDTITELDTAGINFVGVGENLKSAERVKYVKKNNSILAIINCCEHEFSIATESKPGANPLNPISQYYAISEAKKKADYILVIVHGGHERWQFPSPRMVETYRYFIDIGADAVVNHHQHCYSGFETYKNKPIFYGLGNLCFPSFWEEDELWNFGYLILINFDRTISFKLIPYSQCYHSPKIEILSGNAFDQNLARINAVINNEQELKKKTEEYFDGSENFIREVFEPYHGRFSSKLYRIGLLPSLIKGSKLQLIKNYIMCESHRDKVTYCLK